MSSRLTDANAVDTASSAMPDAVITSLLDISAVVGAVIGVMTTSWPLALALLAFLVVRALVEMSLVRRAARLTRTALDAMTESQAVTLGMVSGSTGCGSPARSDAPSRCGPAPRRRRPRWKCGSDALPWSNR